MSRGTISGREYPLAFLSEGDEVEIKEVRGKKEIIQHLSDMGFTSLARVKILSSNPPGPMLVEVRDSRIALGRDVALKIIVSSGDNSDTGGIGGQP